MKVCDVVMNSVWYDPRVRKQIVEYQRNGIEVVAIGLRCGRYDENKIKDMPCKTTVVQIDSRYYGKQSNVFRKIKRERLQQKAVKEAIIAEKPDVIHANDLNALIPAYEAQKALGCRLIYDAHEVFAENFATVRKFAYATYLKLKEQKITKKVDLMVCVSHAAADYYEKKYRIKRPTVITNCSLKAEQCVSEYKNEGFEILNHGQYYAGRGYDVMIEAAPYLKDYPDIKIALRGFGAIEDQLRARAKEVGDSNIRFYPKVLVKELIPCAATAMVGVAITEVLCLNYELSVSNKLFEYASAGLPVIMSDIPEHRYLNEKYNFGIIIPDNTPKSLAEAAIRLYNDKELYAEYANNAKRLSDEINWENEFEKLIKTELELINGQE